MKKGKSILWMWAASYIIVLFIPLITVFINYSLNVRTIKQGIIHANELTLDNVGDQIDRYLEMEREYYSFAFSGKNFEDLRLCTDMDSQFYHYATELYSRLMNYRSSTQSPLHGMIYMKEWDYIVSDSMAYSAAVYSDALEYVNESLERQEWRAILEKVYTNEHFVSSGVIFEEGPALYFANTMKNMSYRGTTIFVGIPLAEIEKLTEYLAPENTLVLWIDEEPAAAFHGGVVTEIPADQLADIAGWTELIVESRVEGISYSLRLSEQVLEQELTGTRRTFAFNVVLTLVFGVLGTVFLLRQNYQPVRELLQETMDGMISGNEFQEISRVVQELKRENKNSRETVDIQRKELVSSWLLSLMKGRTTSLQTKERDSFFGIDFEGPVAMAGFMIPISDQRNIQYDELIFFVVNNIFEELMERFRSYRVEDGRFLLYLFDLQNATEEAWWSYAMEKTEYLCTMLEEKWGVSLIGVVSDTEKELENVRFIYRKVMEAFEYQSVVGGFGAFSTQALENQEEDSRLMEYVRTELGAALKEGNLKKSLEVTEKFFFGQRELPFATLKMYIFDAYNIVTDVFREYETDPISRADLFRYVELLTQAKEPEALQSAFGKILEVVCDRITVKWQLESWSVVDRVKEYVLQHYQDQSLNISTIGEGIHRNPKYISRVFKEETGEGILDYINRYRVSMAKELMAARKYTYEEIANMVGYPEGRTLRRAFVKITGTTPSKYVLDDHVNSK